MDVSIDLETLGTNVDSTILSIGACTFCRVTGAIADEFHVKVLYAENEPVNATVGTIKFWLGQAMLNPDATSEITSNFGYELSSALWQFKLWFEKVGGTCVWANGTKFDIGMLEYQIKRCPMIMEVPWKHNADRCMRTLKDLVGQIEIEDQGTAHNALADAKWQAKYISAALNQLEIKNESKSI